MFFPTQDKRRKSEKIPKGTFIGRIRRLGTRAHHRPQQGQGRNGSHDGGDYPEQHVASISEHCLFSNCNRSRKPDWGDWSRIRLPADGNRLHLTVQTGLATSDLLQKACGRIACFKPPVSIGVEQL